MTDQPLPPAILAGSLPGFPTTAADWTPDDQALPLPGLEDDRDQDSALERAVRRTIRALDAQGLLTEIHAARCQLLLDLARGYARSTAGGKVTVAASAVAGQIQALLESLPEPVEGGEQDAWSQLVAEFRAAGRGTASGHAADPGATD